MQKTKKKQKTKQNTNFFALTQMDTMKIRMICRSGEGRGRQILCQIVGVCGSRIGWVDGNFFNQSTIDMLENFQTSTDPPI